MSRLAWLSSARRYLGEETAELEGFPKFGGVSQACMVLIRRFWDLAATVHSSGEAMSDRGSTCRVIEMGWRKILETENYSPHDSKREGIMPYTAP